MGRGTLFPDESRTFRDEKTGAKIRQITTHASIHHHPFYYIPAYDDAMRHRSRYDVQRSRANYNFAAVFFFPALLSNGRCLYWPLRTRRLSHSSQLSSRVA